jgi:hypothetical protein
MPQIRVPAPTSAPSATGHVTVLDAATGDFGFVANSNSLNSHECKCLNGLCDRRLHLQLARSHTVGWRSVALRYLSANGWGRSQTVRTQGRTAAPSIFMPAVQRSRGQVFIFNPPTFPRKTLRAQWKSTQKTSQCKAAGRKCERPRLQREKRVPRYSPRLRSSTCTRSGRSEMMPSTPMSRSLFTMAGSFTVHGITRTPRALASARMAGVR